MIPADFDRFAEVLRAFAEIKGKQLSAPAIELYWHAMRGEWSLDEFRMAAARLLKTAKFFPTPAEFEALREAARPTTGEAWARARAHARSLPTSGGFLQETSSGDPELDAAALGIGGYKAIANASERDLHFLEPRFAEHFETQRVADDTRAALPQQLANDPPDRRIALLKDRSIANS